MTRRPSGALLTDDVHLHIPGRNAIAGDHHRIDAVLAYFRRRRDLVERTLQLYPGDVLVGDGDHIAALTDRTARAGRQDALSDDMAVMYIANRAGCVT